MATVQGSLHNSSRSSATSDGSNWSKSSCERPERCELTVTSVNQTQKLLRLLRHLPQPDPRRDEGATPWCDLFSLESLRLTLPQIIQDCRLQEATVLEEFPFSSHLSAFGTFVKHPSPSPSRPKAHIDLDALSLKRKYLKLLVRFYQNRIHWLSIDSRRSFGLVQGKRLVVLAEDSNEVGVVSRRGLERYHKCLRLFIEEQLQHKEAVYFVSFGGKATPTRPRPLSFLAKKTQCKSVAEDWVSLLQGSGSCNLLDGLRVAFSVQPSVDTICVIVHTQPDQSLTLVRDHLVDLLSGEKTPRLHFVGFHCPTPSLAAGLAELATETGSHYHSVQECGGGEGEEHYEVADSDITALRAAITRTQTTLTDVDHLKHGVLEEPILRILRELSLTTEWVEDDDFPGVPRPSGDHAHICDSREWLHTHSVQSVGLSLYKFLRPNAYPQLSEHVQIIDKMAVSHVYDVMPVFTWHDGNIKYLHIDVEGFREYIHTLTTYTFHTLTPRLQWLLSGSNVPFGVLTEPRVLLVLDSSYPVLANVLSLQQHLRVLLEEQIAHLESFNMVRFGLETAQLSEDWCHPNRQTLVEAWEWILGLSPAGSCDLLSALRRVFECDQLLACSSEGDDNRVGVYLIVTCLPDQSLETVCGYIEQQISAQPVTLHVVYYNMEFSVGGLVVPGKEGGRFGSEEQTEEYLRTVAKAGQGRFHHFRVSGSCESDDTDLLLREISHAQSYLTTAEKLLQDYQEFCKRNAPPPPHLTSSGSPEHRHPPPPTHPRQTAASLARLNACTKRAASLHRPTTSKIKRERQLKTLSLYTGRGIQKVTSWDLQPSSSQSPKKKTSPLIPVKEAHISSQEWLSKYSLAKLDLNFSKFQPPKPPSRGGTVGAKVTHKHINARGEVVDLLVSRAGLKSYVAELQSVLNRYQSRLEWLSEDRSSFVGVVTESDVVFLLDVSSSMTAYLDTMVQGLSQALRDPPAQLKRFNIVVYSTQVVKWSDSLSPVSMETASEAIQWLHTLKAEGGSCLLDAVKVALETGARGVYLVTDGAFNHTQEFLLSQQSVLRQRFGEKWRLNTVTFPDTSSDALCFLKTLAHTMGGRFHVAMDTSGDDQCLLTKEFIKGQNCLKQANSLL